MRKSIHSKRQKQLCDLLKAARKNAGLTQGDVAKRLRTFTTYVSRYERGDRRLDVIEYLDVADALRVDPVILLAKVRA